MNNVPEQLRLSERYQFRVIVENNGCRFAGLLILDPSGCTLTVSGDDTESRAHDFSWKGISELHCTSREGSFVLRGLVCLTAFDQLLERLPHVIGHFEISYSVSSAIFHRGQRTRVPSCTGIQIRSPSIDRWVGVTKTQAAIASAAEAGNLLRPDGPSNDEFDVAIPGLGHLALAYHTTSEFSLRSFSVSTEFPPVLSLFFEHGKTAEATIAAAGELDDILSFLFGHPLSAESIELVTADNTTRHSSLYVTRSTQKNPDTTPVHAFFPLGKDLLHDQLGLPPLPLSVFPAYLGQAAGKQTYLKKYLRYRQLQNAEERFLGFFRLLEKLCYRKESFLPDDKLGALLARASPLLIRHFGDAKNVRRILRRVPRLNASKLDTAGCLHHLMSGLPSSARERWCYDEGDLGDICKLRNDLTHANEVEPEVAGIERMSKFVEVLLVIRLLLWLDVPVDVAVSVSPRLRGHGLISPR